MICARKNTKCKETEKATQELKSRELKTNQCLFSDRKSQHLLVSSQLILYLESSSDYGKRPSTLTELQQTIISALQRRFSEIGGETLGHGAVSFSWSPRGHIIAVVGSKPVVYLVDRGGSLVQDIPLQKYRDDNEYSATCACQFLKWDCLGENLAIVPKEATLFYVWNYTSQEISTIHCAAKIGVLSLVSWSRTKPYLVVGMTKGVVFVYHHQQRRKIPVDVKHTKAITAAEWVDDDHFVLASDDKQISLNNAIDGQCISTMGFKQHLNSLSCFPDQKKQVHLLSVCTAKKTIMTVKIARSKEDQSLCLSANTQEVMTVDGNSPIDYHCWMNSNQILFFQHSGRSSLVSLLEKTTKPLLENVLTDEICSIDFVLSRLKMVVASETEIKVLTFSEKLDNTSVKPISDDSAERINQVGWTTDGQILTVSTKSGHLRSLLSDLPLMRDVWMNHVLYLTSLMQMEIVDTRRRSKSIRFRLRVEPTQCAIGPEHVAVALQNMVWFYQYNADLSSEPVELGCVKYDSNIDEIKIAHKSVFLLTSKRVTAQHLTVSGVPKDEFYLPENEDSKDEVLCFDAAQEFAVVGSQNGLLTFHRHSDFKSFLVHKHSLGVLTVKAQHFNVRVAFIDISRTILVLNPVTGTFSKVDLTDAVNPKLVWDWTDDSCLGVCSDCSFHPFMISSSCQQSEFLQSLPTQEIPRSYTPIALNDRHIHVQHKNGSLDRLMLRAKECLQGLDDILTTARKDDEDKAKSTFFELVDLNRLHDAWCLASKYKERNWLEHLAARCLQTCHLPLAIEVYCELNRPSLVQRLQDLEQMEEKDLLVGHILVLLGVDLKPAKELFLRSSEPVNAVYLLEDLEQWEEAERIARDVEPSRVPFILFSHAETLELNSMHSESLANYIKALDEYLKQAEHKESDGFEARCKGGAAKMLICLGRLMEAKTLFQELEDPTLLNCCAEILESRKLTNEAANLYEKGGNIKKAALLYISAKNLTTALPLVAEVKDPEVYKNFANAKEQAKCYEEALEAYEKAGSAVDAVRVLLECMKAPEKAFQYLRENYDEKSCELVRKYCKHHSFLREYIEFSLKMDDYDSALDFAKKYRLLEELKSQLSEEAPKKYWRTLGDCMKDLGDLESVGDCHAAAGEPVQAIDAYMKSGPKTIKKCLDVVHKTEDKSIVTPLVDWILSLDDKILESADLLVLFDFQLATGRKGEAIEFVSKHAMTQQRAGNYGVAHKILTSMCVRIKELNQSIPSQLYRDSLLLHSYVIARSQLEKGSNELAARLLIRVCGTISTFPSHASSILTSAIVSCQRANFKKSAAELAKLACLPEHRTKLDPSYRRKIENLLRKPDKDATDPNRVEVPCVYCGQDGDEMELLCQKCSAQIPFCIVTGKRVVSADLSRCPACLFPGRYSALKEISTCPFCNVCFQSEQLTLLDRL